MRKVLHIAFAGGGVDIAVRLITKNVNAHHFEFAVLRESDHADYFNKKGEKIPSEVLKVSRSISFSDLKNLVYLIKVVKRVSPDIMHLHSAKAGVLGRIVGRILKVPSYYTPHAFSFLSVPQGKKRSLYILIEKLTRLISYKSEVIACSKSEFQRAIEDIGFKKDEVRLFNNSIPQISQNSIELPPEFTLTGDYLCTIGRPSYQKNLVKMIEIIEKLHDMGYKVKLVVLGVGYYSPELEKVKGLVSEKGLNDYVTLFPWVNRDQGLAILKNSCLYLSTALYEGLPLSIIEAMALKIPVVASNVDGNKDLVVDELTGYLVNNFSMDHYVERIKELIDHPKKRNQMGILAYQKYQTEFDSKKNIFQLEKIYSI